MANAAKKIRNTFINRQLSLTLKDLRFENAELKPNEISMALCYFMKNRHLSRTLIKSQSKGRKQVWLYTYHDQKLPKDQNASC